MLNLKPLAVVVFFLFACGAESSAPQPVQAQRQAMSLAVAAIEEEWSTDPLLWSGLLGISTTLRLHWGEVGAARGSLARLVAEARSNQDAEGREGQVAQLAMVMAEAGWSGEALRLIDDIHDDAVQAHALGGIAVVQAQEGKIGAARSLLARLPVGAERERWISMSVGGAIAAGHYPIARALAAERASSSQDATEFSIFMNAIDHHQIEDAQHSVSLIQSTENRLHALLLLGSELNSQNQRQEALPHLLAARDLLSTSPASVMRDIYADDIAENLARAGAFQEAIALATSPLVGAGRSSLPLGEIARLQALAGDSGAAAHTMGLIPRAGGNFLVNARASALAASIASGTLPPSAIRRIGYPELRARMALEATEELANTGNAHLAPELLEQARRAALLIENREVKDDLLCNISRVQGELGLVEESAETVSSIVKTEWRSSAFASLGATLMRTGDRQAATVAFAEALDAHGDYLSASHQAFVIGKMAESGLLDEARAAALGMSQDGLDEQMHRTEALFNVVAAFTTAGRYEEATALAGNIQDAVKRARAYLIVAGAPLAAQ